MSNDAEIQPALTPEQWAQRFIGEAVATDEAVSMGDGFDTVSFSGHQRHALAALALFGQPFGFAAEDTELLRRLHGLIGIEGVSVQIEYIDDFLEPGDKARIHSLFQRIAALLPHHDSGPSPA